jgi:hypothetical protein
MVWLCTNLSFHSICGGVDSVHEFGLGIDTVVVRERRGYDQSKKTVKEQFGKESIRVLFARKMSQNDRDRE